MNMIYSTEEDLNHTKDADFLSLFFILQGVNRPKR